MLIVASEEDDTIDTMATKQFFENRASAKSNFLLYKMALKTNRIRCDLAQRNCETGSTYPDLNIESFAHTALLISPDNFHYGPGKTSYKSCSHYLSNPTHFEDCMSTDNERYRWGEKSLFDKCDDNCKVVRRLTYNPDFSNMSAMVNSFVQTHKH